MGCRSTFEKNILIFHLKKNAGWICPLVNSYQKKCEIGCWVHKFEFEIERIQSSHFFPYLKKTELVDRVIKKIKEENEAEFFRWCNGDRIDKMIEQIFNWKNNLVFSECNLL